MEAEKKYSIEEYQAAKKIVDAYEKQERSDVRQRLIAFEEDLKILFANNEHYEVEEYRIEENGNLKFEIEILEPEMEGWYQGEFDEEIEKLALKHNLKICVPPWMWNS